VLHVSPSEFGVTQKPLLLEPALQLEVSGHFTVCTVTGGMNIGSANADPVTQAWFKAPVVDGTQTAGLSTVIKVLLTHGLPTNGPGNAVMLH